VVVFDGEVDAEFVDLGLVPFDILYQAGHEVVLDFDAPTQGVDVLLEFEVVDRAGWVVG